MDEVPPIWVDRAGVKANITEVMFSVSNIEVVRLSVFVVPILEWFVVAYIP